MTNRAAGPAGAALFGALALAVLALLLSNNSETRLVLVCLGATALLWPENRRLFLTHRSRGILLAGTAVALSIVTFGNDLARLGTKGEVRVWNVFHYYLGAKYFEELGYEDLYPAALAADREGQDYWRVVKRVRDLNTYQVELRSERADHYRPERSFTPERWHSFKQDVAALSLHREPKEWRNVFRDRGYNGSPVWSALGRLIAGSVPIQKPPGVVLLASLDLILLGITLTLMVRCLGWYRTALLWLLFVASPVNSGRLIGGFLQYDWLCAGIASVCLYRIRRERLAGILIAWAVMTRVFPVVFVAATALPALLALFRHRRIHRRALRYAVSFVLTCCLLFAFGLANGRGIDGWLEFGEAITTHSDSHVTGDRRIGLEHLTAHGLGWHGSEWALDAPPETRADHLERQRGLFAGAASLLLGLFLWAGFRARSWQSQTLGMVPAFALLVMSRYYSSFLILIPLAARRGSACERYLAAGQLGSCAVFYLSRMTGASRFSSYGVLNLALLFCLVFSLGLLVHHRGLFTPKTVSLNPFSHRIRKTDKPGTTCARGNCGEALEPEWVRR